ncbi:YhgE/Pip domain-containing protein [Bifidobacterium castoris]|uniref:ABC-2 family transporter protein n=1 Tax=Bifidobacterium castoris TaxID=2306972 RepID=A0A430F8W9_9BIFI|nr:YhgE/Pip domain-containing protein [Bifidobacterium castoris]RSX49272.1 ABC-2 family transporter protein [Bifidobacterium castoris]
MRNIWFILGRDLKRLLRVPTAWVILFGLTFIPPLYAWFNIAGFWNPYGNTSGIRVAVANEDKGADSDLMGKLELGDQIEDTLKKNHQLGWDFMSRAEAMECVESARCYAAIVIPSDFSDRIANVLTDATNRPQIDYYVNEKANPVAPKITGVGATTVDRQINGTFVSTVSGVIGDIVNKTNTKIKDDSTTTVAKTTAQLNKTKSKLEDARTTIAQLRETLGTTKSKTAAAREALDDVTAASTNASDGLTTANDLLTKSQGSINTFAGNASNQLDKGGNLMLQATGRASSDATRIANGVLTASGATGAALNNMTSVNEDTAKILDDLKNLPDNPLSEQINEIVTLLEQENRKSAQTLASLTELNQSTQQAATNSLSTINQFSTTSTSTIDSLAGARSTINSSALPQLNAGLSSLAGTSGALAGSLNGQASLSAQAKLVLDQIDSISEDADSSLASTDGLLKTFIDRLDTTSTDLGALANTDLLAQLTGADGDVDVSRIANFMLSPTVLKTHTLYPVDTYGSAMAPLFTSLALWVGAFMLMVLIRLEVDHEGLEDRDPKMWQTYLARFLLLALIASLQGVVVAIGDIVIGVQMKSAALFVFTAWFTSIVYVSIAYALSATFMHVGKALVVALIMVQIPGASGLYPIEMMPAFYRALYPLFPFTYSIGAFRETIGGFYDGHWAKDMLMLLLFMALAFAIGLGLRPLMSNFNHLFSRELNEADMVNSERVYTPTHKFSLRQAVAILANQEDYRKRVEARATKFARLYPKLMRGALIAGFVVPIALFVTFSFTNGTKLVALATWIVWILCIITFLMVVESIRNSLRREAELGTLDKDALRDLVLSRGIITMPSAPKFAKTYAKAAKTIADSDDDDDDDEEEEEEADMGDLEDTLDLDLHELRERLTKGVHGLRQRHGQHDGRHSA